MSPRFYFGLAALSALAVAAVVFWPAARPQLEERWSKPESSRKTVDVKRTVSAGQSPDFLKQIRRVDGRIFTAFDFLDCGQVSPKPPVSTTPFQALKLMNSDVTVEQR